MVLPVLNGLAHSDALDARLGSVHGLGGVCYILATLAAGGAMRHMIPRDLLFGARSRQTPPQVPALAALFSSTAALVRVTETIPQDLGEKWYMPAAGAAFTCLMSGTVGRSWRRMKEMPSLGRSWQKQRQS
jgi:2-dehydropantoate 2-reductase